ncbi:MAG: hypothetical protein HYT86_01595 [candidate division NC10 bacterium]|nr:hypothetical protein [candidate division NC10 bacterium]
MYSDVYYHRTTRAVDLQMREIFEDTMAELLPEDPRRRLDQYLEITEWFLLQKVLEWAAPGRRGVTPKQRELGRRWRDILDRRVKWKMAYDYVATMNEAHQVMDFWKPDTLKEAIRQQLPPRLRKTAFEVDMATQDPRPLNPLAEGGKTVNVFNPATGEVSPRALREFFKDVPAKVAHYRVFAPDHRHDPELAQATELALHAGRPEAYETNL